MLRVGLSSEKILISKRSYLGLNAQDALDTHLQGLYEQGVIPSYGQGITSLGWASAAWATAHRARSEQGS